jgi:predicted nuclease of predicted toxin-antitoxin system
LTRLLLDQGLPRSTAKLLSDAGWDVAHVGDIGLSRAEDLRILEHARQDNRICVTLDADFHSLLATSEAKSPSVVRIRREGLNGKAICDLLLKIWPRIETAVNEGALVTITERSVRVRALPIAIKKP